MIITAVIPQVVAIFFSYIPGRIALSIRGDFLRAVTKIGSDGLFWAATQIYSESTWAKGKPRASAAGNQQRGPSGSVERPLLHSPVDGEKEEHCFPIAPSILDSGDSIEALSLQGGTERYLKFRDPPLKGVLNYVGGVDHAIVRSDCMHDVNPEGETYSSLCRYLLVDDATILAPQFISHRFPVQISQKPGPVKCLAGALKTNSQGRRGIGRWAPYSRLGGSHAPTLPRSGDPCPCFYVMVTAPLKSYPDELSHWHFEGESLIFFILYRGSLSSPIERGHRLALASSRRPRRGGEQKAIATREQVKIAISDIRNWLSLSHTASACADAHPVSRGGDIPIVASPTSEHQRNLGRWAEAAHSHWQEYG
ncbi:hypothetical protein BC826DRAFT_965713 [Russula brevipes]|nr:hypothetical protein BC826DRAFT_965713 [Russula brevipes]